MKKIIYMLLCMFLVFGFAGCESSGDNGEKEPEVKQMTAEEIEEKVEEISNWVTGDIWNDGFNDISWYLFTGKDSTGSDIDIDFSLSELDKAMMKKAGYDTFVTGLNDDYATLKEYWAKLSPEIDKLYDLIKKSEIQPNSDIGLNTDLFDQYYLKFNEACTEIMFRQ